MQLVKDVEELTRVLFKFNPNVEGLKAQSDEIGDPFQLVTASLAIRRNDPRVIVSQLLLVLQDFSSCPDGLVEAFAGSLKGWEVHDLGGRIIQKGLLGLAVALPVSTAVSLSALSWASS